MKKIKWKFFLITADLDSAAYLTELLIRRKPVYSSWYGRRQQFVKCSSIYKQMRRADLCKPGIVFLILFTKYLNECHLRNIHLISKNYSLSERYPMSATFYCITSFLAPSIKIIQNTCGYLPDLFRYIWYPTVY